MSDCNCWTASSMSLTLVDEVFVALFERRLFGERVEVDVAEALDLLAEHLDFGLELGTVDRGLFVGFAPRAVGDVRFGQVHVEVVDAALFDRLGA